MTPLEIFLALLAGGLGSFLASTISTALQGWKWKTGEQPKSVADTANVLTDTSTRLIKEMREEMKRRDDDNARELAEMRTEMESRDKAHVDRINWVISENKRLLEENKALLERLGDVQDWAERLVLQVKSLNLEPVKIRTGPLRAK